MNYKQVEINGTIYIKVTKGDFVSMIPTDEGNTDYQEYLASLEATEPEAE
jgi:hypothetical protein